MKNVIIAFVLLSIGAMIGIVFMCLFQINKGADAMDYLLEAKQNERENNESKG